MAARQRDHRDGDGALRAKEGCARLLNALYEASLHFDLRRMPELFCGFQPRPYEGPTLYPVACAPQAWAAGAVFLLLQACLGLEIDAQRAQIVLDRPILPICLERLTIHRLVVGSARVDLVLENHAHDVAFTSPRAMATSPW